MSIQMVTPLHSRQRGGKDMKRLQRVAGMSLGLMLATIVLASLSDSQPTPSKSFAREASLQHSVLAGASMFEGTAPTPQLQEGEGAENQVPLEGEEVAKANPGAEAALEDEKGEETETKEGAGEEGKGEGEGEGKGEEGEEEEEEEEEAVVKVRWGFAFVTIIIVFSVVFEYGCEFLKESLPDQEEVISCLLEELTTLGFLGFAFFLFTVPIENGESLIEKASIYSLHEPEALEELFEGLHYLVFFGSLSFIFCTAAGLYVFAVTGKADWTKYEEDGEKVLEYDDEKQEWKNTQLLRIDPMKANTNASLYKEWQKEDCVKKAEYLRIRTRFIQDNSEPPLDGDFEFLGYLQDRVSEVFTSMIKITWVDWLVTWLMIALFFGVVEEGVTAEKLLAVYWFTLFMIIAVCILLQAKAVWIKQQLIPRLPEEMQSRHSKSKKLVLHPVYVDQPLVQIGPDQWIPSWMPEAVSSYIKGVIAPRPSNKHERLFFGEVNGPTIMSHGIRLGMFWSIISLAMLLSHHMPGIVKFGAELCWGSKWGGYILFASMTAMHAISIAIVYMTAQTFAVASSVEMLKDNEIIEKIVRKQKFAKCQKAINMLQQLKFFMQQAQMMKEMADGTVTQRSWAPQNEEQEQELAELTALFEHFDEDGSGELSKDEVGALLQTMGTNLSEPELENLVKMMDKDGSGEISLDELAGVMLSKKQDTKLSEVAEQLFKMFDADDSGEVKVDEMMETFSSTGKAWDMDEVKDFFNLIDTDGNGTVEKREFLEFIADVEAMYK